MLISADDLRALYIGTVEPLTEEQQALYRDTVLTVLKDDLWTPRDMYDACHHLMVPMHYAFRAGDETAVRAFSDQFSQFIADVGEKDIYSFQTHNKLDRLQFFYFCTQFMVLCAAYGYDDLIPDALPVLAETFAEDYLLYTEANWKTERTVIEHIRQVLAGKEYSRRYYSSIEDLDRYSLAILCDLRCLAVMRGCQPSETMDTAADLAWQIYSSPLLNTETDVGGWLFQVGVGSDYGDNAYAGNLSITEDIQPMPREDIPVDSNHSMRLPLLLTSYQSAQPDREHWEIFRLRKKQLANQLVRCVLKNVDGHWLVTTFMDGTNGVYRYEYHEKGAGLEGYDLSDSLLMGWWALLEDPRIKQVYQDILDTFPMEGNVENPFFDTVTVYETGMFECIVACAEKF